MKQVVVIHGGDAFATYEEYLQFLKSYPITGIDYFKRKGDWKAHLQEALGQDYEVLLPQMPNKWNAKSVEWKLWFERMFPFLEDGVILIGHSLGGSFLARYLAEERFPTQVAATFLVAAPYGMSCEGMLPEFTAPASLELLAQQGGKIFLYFSDDDPVVPFAELAKYQAALPAAHTRTFSDRGHFIQDEFPELVADINTLA